MSMNVTYDYDHETYRGTAKVDVQWQAGKPVAPPIHLTKGKWTVIWTLESGIFVDLKVTTQPPNFFYPKPCSCSGNTCTMDFENCVVGANTSAYEIHAKLDPKGKPIIGDPTIAVTADPYGGSRRPHKSHEAGVVAERV